MSHSFQQTEGVILRVIPFRDYDQIITLFTQDIGILKVLFKGSRSKRRGVQGICLPLTRVEVVYREKNSEIFACQEMALLESYTGLRKKLNFLNVACDLLQVVAGSQLVGKPAPLLYALLLFYLEKISTISDPWVLAMSFRLKLLKHEGLITYPFFCSICRHDLWSEGYQEEGEWWCKEHQQMGSVYWHPEELQLLYQLALCQHYQELSVCQMSTCVQDKMKDFFETCLKVAHG